MKFDYLQKKIISSSPGFGFVTFENEDVVEKVCEIHFHEINNKMVRPCNCDTALMSSSHTETRGTEM